MANYTISIELFQDKLHKHTQTTQKYIIIIIIIIII
jgi:hypothetical protein